MTDSDSFLSCKQSQNLPMHFCYYGKSFNNGLSSVISAADSVPLYVQWTDHLPPIDFTIEIIHLNLRGKTPDSGH